MFILSRRCRIILIKKYLFIFIAVISVYIVFKYNYVLLQKINTQYLIETNQSSRVFPHRVNSIGKLRAIWEDGFRSFEVDVIYGYNNLNYFQVGHDPNAIGSSNLEELLLAIEYKKVKRIWLDLKNLSSNNYFKIMERLEYLERKFGIKNKVILESGTTLPLFRKFSELGWHISYYIPTDVLIHQDAKNTLQLEQMAQNIAIQSDAQQLSAVSFDNRLYPFIKRYLNPLISKEIVYHSWWGPSLRKINFRSTLIENKLFLDERVKTILIGYKSRHNI